MSATGAATAIGGEEAREVRGATTEQQTGAWHACTVCFVYPLYRLPLFV